MTTSPPANCASIIETMSHKPSRAAGPRSGHLAADAELPPAQTRSIRRLEAITGPLNELARRSPGLITAKPGRFEVAAERHELPRYLFIGPQGGAEPLRIGIFAALHGDEPEGAYALVRFTRSLAAKPELATGYCLFLYPVCNPTGFDDRTRHSRSGKDLNREFWINSSEPEVRLLQAELVSHSFHGIISLHSDDTSHGFYGYARGATLTKHLIEPALRAVEPILPRDQRDVIDGFQARNGVVHDCFDGVLSAPPKERPRPFEIILETPKAPPAYVKEGAFGLALQTILAEYRKFIAYAANL